MVALDEQHRLLELASRRVLAPTFVVASSLGKTVPARGCTLAELVVQAGELREGWVIADRSFVEPSPEVASYVALSEIQIALRDLTAGLLNTALAFLPRASRRVVSLAPSDMVVRMLADISQPIGVFTVDQDEVLRAIQAALLLEQD